MSTPHRKNLHINPLKKSSVLGATLALLGIDGAMTVHHGSQGCTAFTKNILTQHFREITPMQTTALSDIATIMGDDSNLEQGLNTVIEKNHPQLIGLVSTGISETKGDDLAGGIKRFYEKYPQHQSVAIIPISTPDFQGDAQWGYARAIQTLLEEIYLGDGPVDPQRINLLPDMGMTPGDVEELGEIVESFGLEPIILPDLGSTLGGSTDHYYRVPQGDYGLEQIQQMSCSAHTIAIGHSMENCARVLEQRCGTPWTVLETLTGISASDRLMMELSRLSHRDVPRRYSRQRRQLLDAMLDSHFNFGGRKLGLAAESDLLCSLVTLCRDELGMEISSAVTTSHCPVLAQMQIPGLCVGDLGDLEDQSSTADLLITNSNGGLAAQRLGVPLYPVGYPVKDRLGAPQQCFIGYRGTRQMVYDLGNILLHRDETASFTYKNFQGVLA